jgi:hypothetical protein
MTAVHFLASSGLDERLYVMATVQEVIRVVHIKYNEGNRRHYLIFMSWIKDIHFPWVYNSNLAVTLFTAEEYKHCVDDFTLKSTLAIWQALNGLIQERQLPNSDDLFLFPTVIAYWNRIQGGIDVFSRHLKNVHAQHKKLHPYGAVWLRMIVALAYNAHRCYTLFQKYEELMDVQKCKSYKEFNIMKANSNTFADFCRDAVKALEAMTFKRVYVLETHKRYKTVMMMRAIMEEVLSQQCIKAERSFLQMLSSLHVVLIGLRIMLLYHKNQKTMHNVLPSES